MSMFQKAVRHDVKLRIGFAGPSGSGKTYSAIRVAMALAKAHAPTKGPGSGRVAVIDTERDSAQLYAGERTDEGVMDFDCAVVDDFRPETFTRAIKGAMQAGYPVIVIDSLSHAWEGILELKDATGPGFDAWKKVTPVHNELVDLILRYPGHVIACARVKTEYVVEQVESRSGKMQSVPKKVGLAPVTRAGMEYEFTVFGDLEPGTNTLTISKTRCSALQGRTWIKPGAEFAQVLIDWLAGAQAAPPVAAPTPATKHHPGWDKARAGFCAQLGGLGLKYEDLAAFQEDRKPDPKPRPSAMDPRHHRAFLGALEPGQALRTEFDHWLEDRKADAAERAAIQGEGA